MNYFSAISSLLAGVGAFLIGFKLLSDGTEKLATGGLRNLFSKTSKNPFVGLGIGVVTTGIVQSSSVTTVMVVGFVNAGIMSLYQATAVIMGANIGTTLTAQIVALQSFDFVEIAMLLSFVGMMLSIIVKKEKIKVLGITLAGLGLLFFGLNAMSDSMNQFRSSPVIVDALNAVTNPFLLLLIGILVTGVIQSSAAVAAIIISMVATGITIGGGGNSALYVILGTNIGTCVTALLSSVGATTNAKRASFIHLMFNVLGCVIFFVFLVCWKDFSAKVWSKWFTLPATQIAMFHTFFNIICAIIFMPFIKFFVKASEFCIREKKVEPEQKKGVATAYLDERLLLTPSVALLQVEREVVRMAECCMDTLKSAMNGFFNVDTNEKAVVKAEIENAALINEQIIDYLVKISSRDTLLTDEKAVSNVHHVLADILRISEVADNVTKYTDKASAESLSFSDAVIADLKKMYEILERLYCVSMETFSTKNKERLAAVDSYEEQVDEIRKSLVDDHIKRLNEGACRPESSGIFINLVSNLERVGDHLTYVAHSIAETTEKP